MDIDYRKAKSKNFQHMGHLDPIPYRTGHKPLFTPSETSLPIATSQTPTESTHSKSVVSKVRDTYSIELLRAPPSSERNLPLENILFTGDLRKANEIALATRKWIIVAIQYPNYLVGDIYNTKVWGNERVQRSVKNSFIFIQCSPESPDGITLINRINLATNDPFVAVIDPRNGTYIPLRCKTEEELLEDIDSFLRFNPPGKEAPMETDIEAALNIIFKGDYQAAKAHAIENNKHLLINIQDPTSYSCINLNRGLWVDNQVRELMKESLVFAQYDVESSSAIEYAKFNSVSQLPYVAFVDPSTDKCTREFPMISTMGAKSWIGEAKEHLTSSPPFTATRLKSKASNPRIAQYAQQGNSCIICSSQIHRCNECPMQGDRALLLTRRSLIQNWSNRVLANNAIEIINLLIEELDAMDLKPTPVVAERERTCFSTPLATEEEKPIISPDILPTVQSEAQLAAKLSKASHTKPIAILEKSCWTCAKCHTFNFATNPACCACSTPKISVHIIDPVFEHSEDSLGNIEKIRETIETLEATVKELKKTKEAYEKKEVKKNLKIKNDARLALLVKCVNDLWQDFQETK